jgi:hypothetical protein
MTARRKFCTRCDSSDRRLERKRLACHAESSKACPCKGGLSAEPPTIRPACAACPRCPVCPAEVFRKGPHLCRCLLPTANIPVRCPASPARPRCPVCPPEVFRQGPISAAAFCQLPTFLSRVPPVPRVPVVPFVPQRFGTKCKLLKTLVLA